MLHSLTVVDPLDIIFHLHNALVDVIERGKSDVSFDLCPRRQLVDFIGCRGHLSWLHSGRCGKVVDTFLRVL